MRLRHLAPLVLVAVAASAAVARAGDGEPPPDLAAKVARALCMAEGQSLGKQAFLAKYGSLDACIEANAAQAQSILDSCRSASQPAACVAQQLGISRRASDNRGRDAAAKLCLAELKKLGEQAFKAKYGSHDACLEQRQQQAQQLEQNCAAAQDPKACLRDALEQRGRKPDPNAVARAKERCRRAADRGACAEAILKSGRKRGK